MKKADFAKQHEEFETWIVWYGDFLMRVIEARRVVRTRFEKCELVEATILRCVARWEVLITRDIVTSLNRDSSAYAQALGLRLRKHLSWDECKAIVLGTRYIDFRNVSELKCFGKRYLVAAHNPFAGITPQLYKKIDEFSVMRNLLAHYSDYAWRTYYDFMKKRYHYQRVPEPGTFLIAITPSREYRWSEYFRSFLQASHLMMQQVS
jgi:hypothetical protein